MSALDAIRRKFKFDPESPFHYYRKVALWSLIVSGCIMIPFILVELINSGSAVFLYYGDYNGQQIPFYEHCVRMVHEGSLGWDWVTDLGSNFIGSYSYYMLGSPFFWLMCCFPASWVPYLMAPMYMVKYVVAAVFAYAYLQRFVKNKDYAVIGAMLYSFSGFQIYNTFFNQFHDSVAFFPLLLIGMEEFVQNNRKGLFAVAVMINAMISYFMFAGQVFFCVVYFFFRMSNKSFRITLAKFFGLALEAVMGFLLSMFIFLPAATALMGNSRIENSYLDTLKQALDYFSEGKTDQGFQKLKGLFLWKNSGEVYWQRYGQIFESYFFPPDIPSRVNFFSGHGTRWASISMYLPMFALSGVFALFTVRKRGWLKSFIIFLVVCSFVPILNSMFFLFNSSYYARWLYMMIMMLTLATVVSLEDQRTKWRAPTAIMTFFITVIAIPLGLVFHENSKKEFELGFPPYRERFWLYVGLAILGIALTAYIIRRYRGTKLFERALLIGVSAVTVLYSTIHISNGRQYGVYTADFMVNNIIEAEFDMPDPQEKFYRIDQYKVSKMIDNFGIFWELPTMECFHTVVPPSIMEFYPEVLDEKRAVASRIPTKYYGVRALLSVEYSFIETHNNNNGKKHNTKGFTYLESQNGYDIYKNENFVPMGFAFEEFMTETDFDTAYDATASDQMLLKYLIVPDDMVDYYSQFMTRVTADQKASASYTLFQEEVAERREMSCDSFSYSSYGFDATITLDKKNIVFFSVPYEQGGWSATVNGEEVEVLKVDHGFVAVECEAGENSISFDYSTPGLVTSATVTVGESDITLPGGVWLSLIGLIMYVAYMCYYKLYKKQKADNGFFTFDYCDDFGAYEEGTAKKRKRLFK